MSDDTPALSPATVVVHAGRPPRDPDQPLNVPITMASTYVAGGDLESAATRNPTWPPSRRHSAPGRWSRARLLHGAGRRLHRARPGRPGRAGGRAAARVPRQHRPARRPRGARPDQGRCSSTSPTPTPWWRASTTRPSSGSSRRPTLRSRWPTSRPLVRAAPRGRRPGRRRQHVRHAAAAEAAELGADIVVHSATKFLAGHSDIVMGALVVRDPELYDVLKGRRDLIGAIPGTLEAWLALRGLRTLTCGSSERRPTPPSSPGGSRSHPAIECPLPGLRRDRSRSCCRPPRPPTC